jgi:hypothetical protein
MSRFEQALSLIDAANAADPNTVGVDGVLRPAEVVYSERMTAMLTSVEPEASEALRLAARAQHVRRWTIPRSDYPADRTGYLRWRTTLKAKHAEWTAEILSQCGYDPGEIARVAALVRKENLSGNAEAQTLEDVACLVFLGHYAVDFAAKHDETKVVAILAKTWRKMSPRGQAAAQLIAMPEDVRGLLDHARHAGRAAQ